MNFESRLGRTNITVPTCGFGGIPLGRDHLTDLEGENLVRRAIDEGLTLIDTFSGYGRSEKRIAGALKGRRDDIVLVTKSRSRFEPDEFEQQIETSLENLEVECLDFLLLKNIDNDDCVARIDGCMEVLYKLKKQGKIRYSGLSSHSPEHSKIALKTGLLDAAEVPYNYANRHFESVLDLAAEMDIGIFAMKPLGGGRIFEETEKGAPSTLPILIDALSFAMAHGSRPVLIPGIGSESELDRYLEAIPRLKMLSDAEKDRLAEGALEFGTEFCRACGYCVSVCPGGIPIDEILPMLDRSQYVKTDNTYKKLIKKQYEMLGYDPDACEECRKCIEECPYNLSIPERLREASVYFSEK